MSRLREKKSAPRKRAAAAGARGGAAHRAQNGGDEVGSAEVGGKPLTSRGKAKPAKPRADATPSAEATAVLIRMPIEVRWRDLDAFNHVNNANYLTYLEETRLRWLQSLPGPWVSADTAPVLAAVQINYRRPVEWPQALIVELFVEQLGKSSVTLGHRIVDAETPEIIFCDGHSVMVWIDRQGGKAASLPEVVRAACGG